MSFLLQPSRGCQVLLEASAELCSLQIVYLWSPAMQCTNDAWRTKGFEGSEGNGGGGAETQAGKWKGQSPIAKATFAITYSPSPVFLIMPSEWLVFGWQDCESKLLEVKAAGIDHAGKVKRDLHHFACMLQQPSSLDPTLKAKTGLEIMLCLYSRCRHIHVTAGVKPDMILTI